MIVAAAAAGVFKLCGVCFGTGYGFAKNPVLCEFRLADDAVEFDRFVYHFGGLLDGSDGSGSGVLPCSTNCVQARRSAFRFIFAIS